MQVASDNDNYAEASGAWSLPLSTGKATYPTLPRNTFHKADSQHCSVFNHEKL